MTALLVGFGGQHSGAPDGQTLDSAAKLGPLSAPTTLNTVSDGAVQDKAEAVQPLRVTAPSTTVVTHPTPTTTVTTVTQTIVKPTTTTIVTTVTTVTVHPATPVNAAVTHATTPPPTTTTTVRTTTTTIPTITASSNGAVPNAPASLGAPSTMVLDDEFNTGSLNTSLWSPTWFANNSVENGTIMSSSNVSVGANGLAMTLAGNSSGGSMPTGGIACSNPDDAQPGHTGFQIAPTPTQPVFVEFKATLPATTSGTVANWPGLWLDGQVWPEDGEIDVMEGGYGYTAYHIHYGTGMGSAQGATINDLSGTHTYGVLWTTTSVTFVYDGADVGTLNEAMTSPMYLCMENSYSSVDPTVLPATMDVRYVRVWN